MDDLPAQASPRNVEPAPSGAGLYDEAYYRSYCGEVPYEADAPRWRQLFEGIAARIVSDVGPATVLDAGCALGLLVHALRRRGVEAWGVDVSPWAIGQVPAPARPYCRVGSLLELEPPVAGASGDLPARVDLVVCIEVVEHMPREQAEAAVASLCARADDVLFSSSPSDFREPTHHNVEPVEGWAERFARQGFVRDLDFDATFVSPWAARFRKRADPWPRVVRGWERVHARLQGEVSELRAAVIRARDAEVRARALEQELAAARRKVESVVGSRTWKLTAPLRKVKGRLAALAGGRPRPSYEMWLRLQGPTGADRARIAAWAQALAAPPVVSIIMPVCDPPLDALERAIASVRAQLYPAWELCIADDASREPRVRALLVSAAADDPRIKVTWREARGHISAASNTALGLATGAWCAFLDHDDELVPHALACVVAEVEAHPGAALVFSDEDKLDESGWRRDPVLKPGWDPDLLRASNYVCHLAAYRTDRVRALGGLRLGLEGAQDHDLVLRYTEDLPPDAMRRVPFVLYQWRAWAGSTAGSVHAKPYVGAACLRAVREHLDRLRAHADIEPVPGAPTTVRVRWGLPPRPRVALVVVVRRDEDCALLGPRLAVLRGTAGVPMSVALVVDAREPAGPAGTLALDAVAREPSVRLVRHRPDDRLQGEEGARLARGLQAATSPGARGGWPMAAVGVELALAALQAEPAPPAGGSSARGSATSGDVDDIIVLLDASVEAAVPGWLEELAAQACRPDIGAAAPLLVDPRGSIASAGLAFARGRAFRPLAGLPPLTGACDGRARSAHTVTAAPGACLVLRAAAWRAVGGLAPEDLADVDLCLRLAARGLRVVWTPETRLTCNGPVLPPGPALDAAASTLMARWPALVAEDPRWSPSVALVDGDPGLAWPPRARVGDVAAWSRG